MKLLISKIEYKKIFKILGFKPNIFCFFTILYKFLFEYTIKFDNF